MWSQFDLLNIMILLNQYSNFTSVSSLTKLISKFWKNYKAFLNLLYKDCLK